MAQYHLSQLAGKPVIAVTFPLDKWDLIIKILSNSQNLGIYKYIHVYLYMYV
jgi:hypothetical protein